MTMKEAELVALFLIFLLKLVHDLEYKTGCPVRTAAFQCHRYGSGFHYFLLSCSQVNRLADMVFNSTIAIFRDANTERD